MVLNIINSLLRNLKKLKIVLPTVLFVLVFAAISTFVPPQSRSIVTVLYIVVFIAIMMLAPIIMRRRVAKHVLESRESPIIRAKLQNVLKILSKDVELNAEMSRQMMKMMLSMIIPIILWFALLPLFSAILVGSSKGGDLVTFCRYVILYSIIIVVFYIIRRPLMPKKFIVPVIEYEVYRSGIFGRGIAIKFPLDKDFELSKNVRRGFVEIYNKRNRQAFRLYTDDVDKLYDIIVKHGKVS